MASQPHISVVIPTYNHSAFISGALESIRSQEFSDWECIVVDDGSTDNTREKVASFCQSTPKIKYYHKENNGAASARNLGIKKSTGRYICFLDSDDIYEPYTLKLFAKAFEKYPDDTFAFGSHIVESIGEGAPSPCRFQLSDVYPNLVYGNFISTVVAVKNEKNNYPLFREDLLTAEDYQFVLDMARNKSGVQINKRLFQYNMGHQNKSTRYISNGSYIEAALNIAEREITELEDSTRNDALTLSVLWEKRIKVLRILSAAFHNQQKELNFLIRCTPAIEYDLWHDLRYVLYRITDVDKRFQVARNLVYFFKNSSNANSKPETNKNLTSITDAVYCGFRLLPFHQRMLKSMQFYVLVPNLNSLKQTLNLLR